MSFIQNGTVSYATQKPSPNFSGQIVPKFIVMHYTAGFTAESAIQTFQSSASRVSAHFTIALDGKVYQHVSMDIAAWHAGPSRHMGYNGLNQHSIGIEIVNAGWFRKDGSIYHRDNIRRHERDMPRMEPHTNSRVGSGTFWWPEYPAEQMQSVAHLTRDIMSEYGIIDIVSHEEIDTRGWKTDPGPMFPMENYKRLVATAPNRDVDADHYQVTAGSLNVRSGPGTNFAVVNSVRKGDIVEVVDDSGDWRRIDLNGNNDGWVHGAYIRRI
jgi:N-acetylmuramoyl-L-alanine amidase